MSGVWTATILGVITGGAVFALWVATCPRQPSLATLLERLDQPGDLLDTDTEDDWKARLGQRTMPVLDDLGIHLDATRADVRMVGVSVDEHLGSKVTCALLPLGFVAAIWALFTTAGVAAPTGLLLGVVVLGMVGGFVAPDLSLRKAAEQRRREFMLALGAYLDLVAVSLAGGMGTEAALTEAARIGDSWSFGLLRRAVEVAQINGATVWSTFDGSSRMSGV